MICKICRIPTATGQEEANDSGVVEHSEKQVREGIREITNGDAEMQVSTLPSGMLVRNT